MIAYSDPVEIPGKILQMERRGQLTISAAWGGRAKALAEALLDLDPSADAEVVAGNGQINNPIKDKIRVEILGYEISKEKFYRVKRDQNGGRTYRIGCGCITIVFFVLLMLMCVG